MMNKAAHDAMTAELQAFLDKVNADEPGRWQGSLVLVDRKNEGHYLIEACHMYSSLGLKNSVFSALANSVSALDNGPSDAAHQGG